MTEQEIVSYLKENRLKGVAFGFMPLQVQNWIRDNKKSLKGILITYSDTFNWCEMNTDTPVFSRDYILALPSGFTLPGWVEFDIDSDGWFSPFKEETYQWFNWIGFMSRHPCFNAFGGWIYPFAQDRWYTTPQLEYKNGGSGDSVSIDNIEESVKPQFPEKIRFWREEWTL